MSENSQKFKEISFNSSDIYSLIDLLDSKEAIKLYIFIMSRTNFGKFLDNINKLSQQNIGDYIGAERQNVNRALKHLEADNVIFRQNSKIVRILTPNEIRQYKEDLKNENKDIKDVAQFALDIELSQFKDQKNKVSFDKAKKVSDSLFKDFESVDSGACEISKMIKNYKKRATRKRLFSTVVALIAIYGAEIVYKKFYELHGYSKSLANELKDSLINNIAIIKTNKIVKVSSEYRSIIELEKNDIGLYHSLSIDEIEFIKKYGLSQIGTTAINELVDLVQSFTKHSFKKQRSIENENKRPVH